MSTHDKSFPQHYPDPRPSYLEIDSVPGRNMSDFKENVVKELDQEFQELEGSQTETITDSENGEEEKIRTYLRIRPSKNNTGLFTEKDAKTLAVKLEGLNSKRVPNEKNETLFKFSKILGPKSTQIQVFDECVSSILEKVFANENCLIFGYGATNSGKTHTMQGYGNDFGIVPRTLEYLFNSLEDKLYVNGDMKPHMFNQCVSLSEREISAIYETKAKILRESKGKLTQAEMESFTSSLRPSFTGSNSSNASNIHASIINSVPAIVPGEKYDVPDDATLYGIWVSFAELYNEKVYDLFDSSSGKKRKELKLMADKKGHVYIKDLIEVSITSAEEAYKLFLSGKANLQFAATEMNGTSSRSHCFFSIRIVTVGTAKGNVYPKTVQQLSFCDLAGAERASQTGNIGTRLKESGNINQSLLVLLRCIRAMRENQNKKQISAEFIPFRESKLTRLFQSYLTTASHICMIVNINPDPKNLESTLQVLHNSAIASEVIAFKKVEPPNNDTKFYKRVRESITSRESMKARSEIVQNQKTDECRYNLRTVVSTKAKSQENVHEQNMVFALAHITDLQNKNYELRDELEERDEEIQQLRNIIALKTQLDEEASIQSEQYQRTFDALNDKRLSMQARFLREEHDKEIALLKQQFEVKLSVSDDEYETLSEEDGDKENCPGNSFQTPKPVNLSKALALKNRKIKELTEANQDLAECVSALQRSLDLKKEEVISLTVEARDKELLYTETMDSQRKIIERLESEIKNLANSDPKEREEESRRQLVELNTENQQLSVENTQLKVDLQDGQTTCLEYDRKLQEANLQIEKLNTALNDAMTETRANREELDIIHYSYEIMQNKLKRLEKYDKEQISTGTVTTPTLHNWYSYPKKYRKKLTPVKPTNQTKPQQKLSAAEIYLPVYKLLS